MTRRAGAWLRALAVGVLALAATGCEQKRTEYSGVGKWRFTTSTRKDARDGVCQPTELNDGRKATWCFAQPPIKIGKRVAEVDLYFDGTTPDARLIEIQLKIRGCVEDDLDQWMRSAFGPPIETRSTRSYWKNAFLWAVALMPSDPGRCIAHFLPLSENAEIERLKQI